MSGIYIPGMEMPKSCYGCIFFKQVDYWNKNDEADILSKCKRTGEFTWESVNGYMPNCHLVPVPEHGRLGDLDDVINDVRHYLCEGCGDYFGPDAKTESCEYCGVMMLIKTIERKPSIIPADPAKEGWG